jgi:hypothetical protein
MTILIFIALIVGVYFIAFNKANTTQKAAVSSEGGMLIKYGHVVMMLLQTDKVLTVRENNQTSATIYKTSDMQSEYYTLIHTFNKLNVVWDYKCPYIGTFNHKWIFDSDMDQQLMVDTIKDGIFKYGFVK